MTAPIDPAPADAVLLALGRVGSAITSAIGRGVAWFLRLPWWVQVLCVWAVGRAYSAFFVVTMAAHQGPNPWSPETPSYLEYINGWDAGWFQEILKSGYPEVLPRDAQGTLVNNTWAFLPGYPYLVRAVMALTGGSWLVVAPAVLMISSAIFFLMAYRLFRQRAEHETTIAALLLITFSTAAPVLQFPYSESTTLVLLTGWLLLMSRGRYLWAALLLPVIALFRPLSAPLACATVIIVVTTALAHRRGGQPLRWTTLASLAVAAVTSIACVGLWPGIVAWRTGIPNAYLLTEATWQQGKHLSVLALFFGSFERYFGADGILVALIALALIAWAMLSAPTLRLGLVSWAWVGATLGYLALIAPFDTTTIRLGLFAFPLALAAMWASPSRAYRTLLIVMAAASQILWFTYAWYWSGKGYPTP